MKFELHNGDCLKIIDKLINDGVKVDLLLTDPPYGINYVSSRRKTKFSYIENDDNLQWLDEFVEKSFKLLKENSHAYVFCSFHNVDIFKQAFEKKFKVKNILIWKKNNTGAGDLFGDYAPKYEMILYLHKGRKLLNGVRNSNILEFKKTNNKYHPTEKPVDLLEFLIVKSTNENETVIDCFMGSGSTGVACKNTNRNFIGIEIDKKYFEIAKNRINFKEDK